MKIYNFIKKAVLLFFCCQMAISAFGQAAQTINPDGGASSLLDDGLKVVVNPTGYLSVYRLNMAQYCCGNIYPNGAGNGVRLTFRFDQNGTNYSTSDLLITACATTPAEQVGNDWTTSITGYVTSPLSGLQFYITMNFFYTYPDKYFLVDYYVRAPHNPSYTIPETVHLYLDHDSYILGKDGSRSYRYVGASPASEFVGDYRLVTDDVGCGGGANNPQYPSHHGFKISGSYRSYYSAGYSSRNTKNATGMLSNTLSPGTCIDDGIAVEFTIGPLSLGQTGVKRIMHAYGENQGEFNSIDVIDPIVPPGVSSPVTVNFTTATYSEQEGNSSHPATTVQITVGGGSLAQDQVVSFTASGGTAVQGTDYSYVKGFTIPAGTYTTPQTFTLNNFTILGNQLCQSNRTFGISIDPNICNDLIILGSSTSATFTIIDDDPLSMDPPSAQTYCPGNAVSVTTFTSSLPNMTYAWSATNGTAIGLPANSGTGNLPAFTALNTGAAAIAATITVTPSQTGSACSGASAAQTYVITVIPPPVVSVSANPSSVCSGGGSPVTFTATVSSGSTTAMTYTWNIAGSSTTTSSNTYSATVTGGSTYSVHIVNSNGCVSAVTAPQTVTVTAGVTPTISISGATATCSGNSETYTASIANGGSSPGYQWLVNGSSVVGETGSTFVYEPENGDIITCVLTSSAACAAPNPVTSFGLTMMVTPTLTPSATIIGVPD